MERVSGRAILFAFVGAALLLMIADHLTSPPLRASVSGGQTACAPCGAPCPSTR